MIPHTGRRCNLASEPFGYGWTPADDIVCPPVGRPPPVHPYPSIEPEANRQ